MAEAQAQPLSQSQFDVLYTLLRAGDALTQRQIQTSTGMPCASARRPATSRNAT